MGLQRKSLPMTSSHREPSTAHPITITPAGKRIRVRWNGKVVAETAHALDLKEASYPVVHYIPRGDADMSLFEKTTRSTHCPFKGDASYFTLTDGSATADNAVWSYEAPFPAVKAIADHLAFYPDKVTFEVVEAQGAGA